MRSAIDALAGQDAFLVVVFDLAHLTDQIGPFDQPRIRLTPGENQLDAGRLYINQRRQVVRRQQAKVSGNIGLVKDDDIMTARGNDLSDLVESGSGKLNILVARLPLQPAAAAVLTAGNQVRKRSSAKISLYFSDLTNWAIKTFRPAPAARRARPIAAVVLPLPSPVYTCT